MLNTRCQHRIEQAEGIDNIVVIVLIGMNRRLTYLRRRCQMTHRLNGIGFKNLLQQFAITTVSHNQALGGHKLTVARDKVIQHEHFIATLQEKLNHMRPDITGTTRYKNPCH